MTIRSGDPLAPRPRDVDFDAERTRDGDVPADLVDEIAEELEEEGVEHAPLEFDELRERLDDEDEALTPDEGRAYPDVEATAPD